MVLPSPGLERWPGALAGCRKTQKFRNEVARASNAACEEPISSRITCSATFLRTSGCAKIIRCDRSALWLTRSSPPGSRIRSCAATAIGLRQAQDRAAYRSASIRSSHRSRPYQQSLVRTKSVRSSQITSHHLSAKSSLQRRPVARSRTEPWAPSGACFLLARGLTSWDSLQCQRIPSAWHN